VAAYAKALVAGDRRELRARVELAASLLQQVEDIHHPADMFKIAGYRAFSNGDDDDAVEYVTRAVAMTRELDDPHQWMLVQGMAGMVALLTDDIAGATAAFREQLELARELVVLPAAFEGLRGLTAVAVREGDLDRAARLSGAAEAHRYGQLEHPADIRVRDTFIAPARTRHGTEAWDTGAGAGAALGFSDAIAYALREAEGEPVAVPMPSVVRH